MSYTLYVASKSVLGTLDSVKKCLVDSLSVRFEVLLVNPFSDMAGPGGHRDLWQVCDRYVTDRGLDARVQTPPVFDAAVHGLFMYWCKSRRALALT